MPDLEPRLQRAFRSDRFHARVRALRARPGILTLAPEQSAMAEIMLEQGAPDVLEIGSFFGFTSRTLADTIVEEGAGGSLVTLDPYGGHRMPGIIAGWPAAQQAVTTFLPLSSMEYFMELEVRGAQSGAKAPFSLTFVDGNHSYEYCLFDIYRCAHHLRPNGVICVDNIDQAGPAAAAAAFLREHRAWRRFQLDGFVPDAFTPESIPDSDCAFLLAPEGIELGPAPHKVLLLTDGATTLQAVRIPLLSASAGELIARAILFNVPYDLSTTGKGLISMAAVGTSVVR